MPERVKRPSPEVRHDLERVSIGRGYLWAVDRGVDATVTEYRWFGYLVMIVGSALTFAGVMWLLGWINSPLLLRVAIALIVAWYLKSAWWAAAFIILMVWRGAQKRASAKD
jgi:hypothetical protein